MSRKFRSTEISGTAIINHHGQFKHANWFCVNCYYVSKQRDEHYPECTKPECYAIPSSAEVPARESSKRKWRIFMNQFVYSKPIGYWFMVEFSWWWQHHDLKRFATRMLWVEKKTQT